MKLDLSHVPPEHREEAERLAREIADAATANPLRMFAPHCAEQQRFLAAHEDIVAAFCGNQSGKSTIGAVKALVQLLPREMVPEALQPYRHPACPWGVPVHGWALCPTEAKIFDSVGPALMKWVPKAALRGGTWSKAFNGDRMQLSFVNGSTLTFKTYKQAPDTLGGATLQFVWYDEPPPQLTRDEAATRLLATGGPEWYTMTPLKSNAGWVRREIWRNRAADHITICKWSMHDNPYLNDKKRKLLLESYKTDIWRKAREFGDFMDMAGQVYPDFDRAVVQRVPPNAMLDHVWGIDPGIRNAAIICGGFDGHGQDWIYNEALIQNGTPTQYAQRIDVLLAFHGLRRTDITFVIDPAARQRSQATGDTVQSELTRVGIYTVNGTNDKEAGQQQIRDRLLHRRIFVHERCVGLRDDADEFMWELDDEDSIGPADDAPFHRLATLRYQVMTRPYYPQMEASAEERLLGRQVNQAIDLRHLRIPQEHGPLGPMS